VVPPQLNLSQTLSSPMRFSSGNVSEAMLKNYVFTLDSCLKSVLPKTQNRLDKPVCFTPTWFS